MREGWGREGAWARSDGAETAPVVATAETVPPQVTVAVQLTGGQWGQAASLPACQLPVVGACTAAWCGAGISIVGVAPWSQGAWRSNGAAFPAHAARSAATPTRIPPRDIMGTNLA